MKIVTRDQIRKLLTERSNIVLIEALPEKHFDDGHLPGAIRLLPEEIRAKAAALLPDKHQLIVTYCANTACQNSKKAAEALLGLGYVNVAEYVEGKQDWIEAGLPLEKGACCSGGRDEKSPSSCGCCQS